MEVLAGVLIGILVTIVLLKHPITININQKHEEIYPEVVMPDLDAELRKAPNGLDDVYKDNMKGFIDEVNSMMLGGNKHDKDGR